MIIKDVLVSKDAINDLEEGKNFYDNQEKGVGDYFWDSLIADMESLVIYAGIHCKKHDFHRMACKRFPYAVYYEIRNEIAYVVAVLPMRRDPAWIVRNIEKRNFARSII